MKKSQKAKLQYIKAINISADRGKVKSCQLCLKDWGLLVKEHQCKRCKRAVCDSCSPHKAAVLNYADKTAHRQCYFCKQETDAMKKFLHDNSIGFSKDTLSVQWLQPYSIDIQTANNDYRDVQQDNQQGKNQTEVTKMKGQLSIIFQELEDWQNYSLREFIFLTTEKVDKSKVQAAIERILTQFLLKYPQVGWSPDLVFITLFLLCFSDEGPAYELLTIIYGNIMPSYLYSASLNAKNYDYAFEVDMILAVSTQGLRMQTSDENAMKYFLQNRVGRYLSTLTLNFLLFETSFFVINQMFLGGNLGYDEFIKSLSSVFTLQATEVKKQSVNYDEAELTLLKNVRAQQTSGLYVQTKQVNLETFKQQAAKFRQPTIQTRSVSMALEKEQAKQVEQDGFKSELVQVRQQKELLQTMVDNQKSELDQLKNEKKQNLQKYKQQDDEYKQIKQDNDQLVEENHNLKLEKMKRQGQEGDAPGVGGGVADTADVLGLTSKVDSLVTERNTLLDQLQQRQIQLDEEKRKQIQLEGQLEYEKKNSTKQKELNDQISIQINEKEQQILKQKQEVELLQLTQSTNSTNSGDQSNDEKFNRIIVQKNEEINTLTASVKDEQNKTNILKNQVEEQKELKRQLEISIESLKKDLSSLQQENQNLAKFKMSESQDMNRSSNAVNMQVILKDLEDGKNLLERKNNEILQLKKINREQEEKIAQLTLNVDSSKTDLAQYEVHSKRQDNQDFNVIMRRATTTPSTEDQIQQDFKLLQGDNDPSKRSAIRNIKNKIEQLEKEVLFRSTDAEIKKEQLQPYKDKSKQLEGDITLLQKSNGDLNLKIKQKDDLIKELNKLNDNLKSNQQQLQALDNSMDTQMLRSKQPISKDDPKVLKENNQGCNDEGGCNIF